VEELMRGYVILGDEATVIDLVPGPRLADGRPVSLDQDRLIIGGDAWPVTVARDGDTVWIHLEGRAHRLTLRDAASHLGQAAEGDLGNELRAPMPGVVVEVLVQTGAVVAEGEALMVIESMKLETTLRSARAGVVATIAAQVGQSFDRDATLITLAEAD
jgi:acetyl/propionyl-CoA carboxylase alpha subunit